SATWSVRFRPDRTWYRHAPFFFQAEDGIRYRNVTGVQTCALPICVSHQHREQREGRLPWIAEVTNPHGLTGSLADAVAGADVFIGVSAGNVLTAEDVATMADRSVVFAMANPVPEIDPAEAVKHAEVVATGRSDFANQINNVLAFPGVFRGLLDAHATRVSDQMLLAAARALADVVTADELNPTYIVPS